MVMIFEAPRRLYLRAYRLPYTAVVFPLYPIHFVPTPSYERRINRKSGSLPHEAVGYNQIGHHSITVPMQILLAVATMYGVDILL